jgi:hypothetical protein
VTRLSPIPSLCVLLAALLAGCASGTPPLDWQSDSFTAMQRFTRNYLAGNSRAAEQEFKSAKEDLSATGRADLVARAELVRCAARTASLEFDNCPGFEKLRADAGPEELAYADFLAGRAARAAGEDPLSRLVNLGVQFKSNQATPESVAAAVEIASAQGWRRPLLAWLGVQEKRAEAAGDSDALARIRRRIALAQGKD